jgi:hypothetical protein
MTDTKQRWLRCRVEGNKLIFPKEIQEHTWIIMDENSKVGDSSPFINLKITTDKRGFERIYAQIAKDKEGKVKC